MHAHSVSSIDVARLRLTQHKACTHNYRGYINAMLLTRDEPKRATNLQVHGLDFADARDRFEWDSALVSSTYPSRHGGARFAAIGFLDGAVVTLVFSLLGTEAISAISLRTASNKERRYEQG